MVRALMPEIRRLAWRAWAKSFPAAESRPAIAVRRNQVHNIHLMPPTPDLQPQL